MSSRARRYSPRLQQLLPNLRHRPASGPVLPTRRSRCRCGHKVVVLGFGVWQRRFGGSPDVLNQSSEVGGEALTIVGVAPPDPAVRAGLFVPLQARPLADGMNTTVGLIVSAILARASRAPPHYFGMLTDRETQLLRQNNMLRSTIVLAIGQLKAFEDGRSAKKAIAQLTRQLEEARDMLEEILRGVQAPCWWIASTATCQTFEGLQISSILKLKNERGSVTSDR